VEDDKWQLEASQRPEFVDLIVGEPLEVGPGLESDNRVFGGLLRELRKEAGLSRADAAAKLGFSAEYLRLIEVGKRTPALGQMRSFLGAYGADGEVEKVMPGGDRPDFVVINPLSGEPVIVEFKSRIREARHNAVGNPPGMVDRQKDLDSHEWVYDSPSPSRAAELGVVVSLLTRADESTLRQIREILEDEVGKGTDAQETGHGDSAAYSRSGSKGSRGQPEPGA
jgi:transcriptional regulator with XRE-family HTH domain